MKKILISVLTFLPFVLVSQQDSSESGKIWLSCVIRPLAGRIIDEVTEYRGELRSRIEGIITLYYIDIAF